MLINPCDNCQIKGICPNIQVIDRMNLKEIVCPQYDIYKRESIYPKKTNKVKSWLTTGVMIDEHIRLDKEDLIDELYMTYFRNSGFQKLYLYKEALSCILGNLVVLGNRNVPLSRPLQKNSKLKSEWFEQKVVDNILKILVENNLCLKWKGVTGQSPKFFLTSELIYKYYTTKTTKPKRYIFMNKTDPRDVKKKKKDQRRVQMTPPYCPMLRDMTEDIEYINKLLTQADVKFTYDPEEHNRPEYEEQLELLVHSGYLLKDGIEYTINKDALYIFRVFNRGDYIYGGRFYTKVFQGIPPKVRMTITIDGEETVELDYSAHHIRLLYQAYEKIDFQGEPYVYAKSDKANADKRQIHKYIYMIAINANSRTGTIHEVLDSLREDSISGKFTSPMPSYDDVSNLYDDFIKHHKPISKYISKDMGIKLQRLDSDIMNNILVELATLNIVALPVHDSIIVQKKHKQKLKELMTKWYYDKVKFKPIIE